MDRQMNRWNDRLVDRQMDRWMDRQMDGWTGTDNPQNPNILQKQNF